jgi:hypothetical protein
MLKTSLRPSHYQPIIALTRANAFVLSKARKVSMSIQEVTFEELLVILRGPSGLVAKAAASAENRDSYNANNARGQSRVGREQNPPR